MIMIKNIAGSFVTAFSMYSRVPMPRIKWVDENMKYVFAFFPLVGVLEGVLFYFLALWLSVSGLGSFFTGVLLTVFTVVYTGGIHLDGFLDVCDAYGSFREKEERLRILKDPHVGSAAVISGITLFLLKTAAYGELKPEAFLITGLSFFLSRTLSALSVLCFPEAYKSGTAFSFREVAGHAVKPLLFLYLVFGAGIALYLSLPGSIVLIALSTVLYFLHYLGSVKNFGGINGDQAGFFLELYEMLVPLLFVIINVAGRPFY